MTSKWKSLLMIVLLPAGIVLVGPSQKVEHYSCHKCRGLKDVTVNAFFGITGKRRDVFQLPTQLMEGHVHDWWRYSVYRQNGLFGSLSKRVACKPTQFQDGQKSAEH